MSGNKFRGMRFNFGSKDPAANYISPLKAIKDSYYGFLTSQNEMYALDTLLKKYFTYETEKTVAEYVSYRYEEDKEAAFNHSRCVDVTLNYKVFITLKEVNKETGEMIQLEHYLGNIPLMRGDATFTINGVQKAIITQLLIGPGIYNEIMEAGDPKTLVTLIQPDRGTWLKFNTNGEDITVKFNTSKRINAMMLLFALGETVNSICDKFFSNKVTFDVIDNNFLVHLEYDADGKLLNGNCLKGYTVSSTISLNDKIIINANHKITTKVLRDLTAAKVKRIPISHGYIGSKLFIEQDIDQLADFEDIENITGFIIDDIVYPIYHSLQVAVRMFTKSKPSQKEASKIVYRTINEDDILPESVEGFATSLFGGNRYDLSECGRYNINRKYKNDERLPEWFNEQVNVVKESSKEINSLSVDDIYMTIGGMLLVFKGLLHEDNMNNIPARRAMFAGEYLYRHLDKALYKVSDMIKNCYRTYEDFSIAKIQTAKTINKHINGEMASSKVVQFCEATNPISTLYNTIRHTAITEHGGTHFKMEAHDIYDDQFGKYDPIATPDSANIGLIIQPVINVKYDKYGYAISSITIESQIAMDLAK